MEKYNLTQTGQEVQDILDNATTQPDLAAEVERAQEAERLLGEGIQQNATDIDSIEGKIPSAASSENKLTDKEYVDGQVDDEKNRAQGVEDTLQNNIDAEELRAKAAEETNANDIDAIEAKIPSGASSENKLATESYVNDAVATSSATFRGTFNLVSDLHLTLEATHANIATALAAAIATADNNDFAFVQIPTDADTPTVIGSIDRYKFNGTDWAYEYTLNNSGFTQAEWDAINSGITSGDVTKLRALPTNAQLTMLLNGKQDTLTFDNVPTENSLNPVKSSGVYSAIKDEETRAKTAEKANADDIDAIEEKIPSSASSSNQLATASDVDSLSAAIEAILLLIPTAASSLNQLADKAFVNSSIATATATFRGTYNLVNDLGLTISATHAQIATALGGAILTSNNNDYAFVQIPTSNAMPTEIAKTERYKFNGTAWEYEYDLNNSGFTADQWAAINSGITQALVAKLAALPTNAELTTELGTLTSGIITINQKIPNAASQANKLVDNEAMESYIVEVLNVLTVSYNVTSTDGHVTLSIEQVNGKVTSVTLTTSDIASAADLNLKASQADLTTLASRVTTAEGNITSLGGRVSTNETDISNLQQLYNNLQQSKPVPVTALPSTGQQQGIIYRLAGTTSYSDYMWNGSSWVLMATYNNAIDPRPKKNSQNLVTSGGVFDNMGALDVSKLNATENPHTLAIYADLSAALAAIPLDYQEGGMSIKFVQSSDNNYVQYRLMSDTFSSNKSDWQGVNNEVAAESLDMVSSGGVAKKFVDLESVTGSVAEKNTIANFKYFYLFDKSLENVRIVTIYNSSSYSKRIIIKTSGGTQVFDHRDIEKPVLTEQFAFYYDWSRHTTNLNVEFANGGLKLKYNERRLADVTPSILSEISNEVGILELNDISKMLTELFDLETTTLSASQTLSDKFIEDNLQIKDYTASSVVYSCYVYPVTNGTVYRIRKNYFNFGIQKPCAIFAESLTNIESDIVDYEYQDRILLRGTVSSINVSFLWTAKKDGYIVTCGRPNHVLIVDEVTALKSLDIRTVKNNVISVQGNYVNTSILDGLYDVESQSAVSASVDLSGSYINTDGLIKSLSSQTYKTHSFAVQKGKFYLIAADSFRLSGDYPCLSFAKTALSVGIETIVIIPSGDTTTAKGYHYLYQCNDDGYLITAETTYGALSVYEAGVTSKIPELESRVSNIEGEITHYNESEIESTNTINGFYSSSGTFTSRTAEYAVVHAYPVTAGTKVRIKGKIVGTGSIYAAIVFSTALETSGIPILQVTEETIGDDVDFIYTIPENGYLNCWEYNTGRYNYQIFSLVETPENRIDILEANVNGLNDNVSPLKDKKLAVLGDSIMMFMRTNDFTNNVTYLGSDGNTYTASEVSVNSLGKVVVSADTSIVCTAINSAQISFDSQDWSRLKNTLGVSNLINLGLGGGTLRMASVETDYPFSDDALDGSGNPIPDVQKTACLPNEVKWLKRLTDAGSKPVPDVILIWLGTNDSSDGEIWDSTNQTVKDLTAFNANFDTVMNASWDDVIADSSAGHALRRTIYGGLRYSLESLYRYYPNATVILVSPCQSRYNLSKAYATGTLGIVTSAMKKMADRYSCIFVDAYDEIGIVDLFEKIKNDAQTTSRWYGDGLHPNAAGKVLYANYIAKRLNGLSYNKV